MSALYAAIICMLMAVSHAYMAARADHGSTVWAVHTIVGGLSILAMFALLVVDGRDRS